MADVFELKVLADVDDMDYGFARADGFL